ncbi:MAG TPA: type II toxin-antitoxin system VapC family toxin [Thermoanaerobaculia bacterium]|nr:type II toxin-antitoxin system VapC family toxin [Thermoanaerobaculia bacterium]
MPTSSRLVLDANLAVRALVATARHEPAVELIASAHEEETLLLAPSLWVAEVTSALRKLVYRKNLAPEEADIALSDLPSLGIQVVPMDLALARQALAWAERLGQIRAYDAFYLALAEREDAILWTGDWRLADRARQLGIDWVRFLEEPEV